MASQPNWSGILFEADSSRFQQLQRLYANNESVICVNCLVSLEGSYSLSSQLTLHNISKFPDLLSIDIDGCDYYLWKEVQLSCTLNTTVRYTNHQITKTVNSGGSRRILT